MKSTKLILSLAFLNIFLFSCNEKNSDISQSEKEKILINSIYSKAIIDKSLENAVKLLEIDTNTNHFSIDYADEFPEDTLNTTQVLDLVLIYATRQFVYRLEFQSNYGQTPFYLLAGKTNMIWSKVKKLKVKSASFSCSEYQKFLLNAQKTVVNQ